MTVSLIDLGPSYEDIEINGKTIRVSGVSAEAIVVIMQEFPELRMMMIERQLTPDNINSAIMRIPRAIGMVIAASIGRTGDEEQIALGAALPFGTQVAFIEAAIKQTFPRGVQSFLESLNALFDAAPGTRGKVPAMRSQAQSSDASAPDMTNGNAGEEHHAN